MIDVPNWLSIGFGAITFAAVFGLWRATKSLTILAATLFVLVISMGLSLTGFYDQPDAVPPRLPFIILPSVVLIILAFASKKGRRIIDQIDFTSLTLIHMVRIPVEFTILALFIFDFMPESMTFEGRNFDILSGLTAPFIAYFGYRRKSISNLGLTIWNLACLALVSQVVITGILAAPSVMQIIEFEQPNVAVLYFPFVWLPAVVVPIVVFAHLASLRQLLKRKESP